MHSSEERYTISSHAEAADARRAIRAHLRPMALWGLAPYSLLGRDAVYGFVLGRLVRARPVSADMALWQLKHALVIKGWITPRHAGCEISLRVHSPQLPALLPRTAFLLGAVLTMALFVGTQQASLLLASISFAALGGVNFVLTRQRRAIEPAQRLLLRHWLDVLEDDLARR